jgi:hypothetical protein
MCGKLMPGTRVDGGVSVWLSIKHVPLEKRTTNAETGISMPGGTLREDNNNNYGVIIYRNDMGTGLDPCE